MITSAGSAAGSDPPSSAASASGKVLKGSIAAVTTVPEALDDRTHVRAHRRAGQQHRRLALSGVALEAGAHRGDKLLQPARRHRQLPVLALADERFGKTLL